MRVSVVFLAGFCVILACGGLDANAAPRGSSKQADNQAASNLQSHEVTLIGILEGNVNEVKDKTGKVIRIDQFYTLTDSKKREWKMLARLYTKDKQDKLKECLGKKVKMVAMVIGNSSNLISIKKIDTL